MPIDGGAILMKEENVVHIPDGLVQEYLCEENLRFHKAKSRKIV